MRLIGRVVQLQVQAASLKVGERPDRRYDPAPIRSLPVLALAATGVEGETEAGSRILDVHNAAHPASKNRGGNGVSLGFTTHYDALRARFGAHLTDGVAGENVLIAADRTYAVDDLAAGLVVVTASGHRVALGRIVVAEPCVEFARFALGREDPSDAATSQALQFLREGRRGFYACLDGPEATIRVGDQVYVAVPSHSVATGADGP